MRLRAAVLALLVACTPAFGAQDPAPAPPQPAPQQPLPQPLPEPPPDLLPPPPPKPEPAQEPTPEPPPPKEPAREPPQRVPKIVRSIKVEGELRYSEAQILSALGQKVGQPYDPDVVNRGIRTLWRSFHVNVQHVYAHEVVSATGEIELDLVVIVVETPSDRQPLFTGNVSFEDETLRKWALIEERVEMFEYQAARVRQRILDGYRREGYYWAEVEIRKRETQETSGELVVPMTDLVFDIREGPRVRVKSIGIEGNRSMRDSGMWFWAEGLTAFSKPQLTDPWLFNWWGSKFVEETLEADVIAMRNVYRERGWLDAQVSYELSWSEDRSDVHVKIIVDEGEPYVVDSLAVEYFEYVKEGNEWRAVPAPPGPGSPQYPSAELIAMCELLPGKRYEQNVQRRDEAKLREFYGERGHLAHPTLPNDMRWAFLEPELFTNPSTHKVQVLYRIVEAHPLTIREISFAGTSHTRDEVLRREVSVFPGERADQKEINRSLSRIEGTQFFSDQFSPEDHRDPTYRYLPVEGSKERVDLVYEVEEGRVVEFNIAGGIDSNEGAFGIISLTLRNFDLVDLPSKWNRSLTELFRKEAFHGAGQKIDLTLSPGTQTSSARVHFNEPDIFGMYLEPISFDLDLRRLYRQYDTHSEDRTDKQVKFGRRIAFDSFFSVGFVHTDLDVYDVEDDVPASLQREELLGRFDLIGFTFDASHRSLDNLIAPANGWRASWRNAVYTARFGSEFDYWRSDLQLDGYLATGTKGDGTKHVLHVELRGGVMPTFNDTVEVPYSEKYFTGGSGTLRGFSLRGAGNRGTDVLGFPTDFPAGGESVLGGSLEWIYPLHSVVQPGTYRAIEMVRGMLFVDWGVLGETASDIDFQDTRASVGFGVGLTFPLPITLNFGYPVRRFSGDERQTFSFNIGFSF